jgi:hypothetical protein
MSVKFRLPEDLPVPRSDARAAEPDHPILVHVALSRSAVLARQGRYPEAERLLAGLKLSPPQAVPVLHLHARMLAQEGRLPEAMEEWKRVLHIEPGHRGAAEGLREVSLVLRRPLWVASLLSWPVAGALFLGFLALALGRSTTRAVPPAAPEEIRKLSADTERIRDRQEALARSQERIEERLLKVPKAGGSGKAPLFDPQILGVTFQAEGEDLVAVFKEPLFDPGSAELRPPAKATVSELATKLAPEGGRLRVRIILELGRPLVESSTLALTRARCLARELRQPGASGLVVTTEIQEGSPPDAPPKETLVPDPVVRLRLSAARN